jgi:beta-phosphoglucomutase-like phosphatase (HAD superfamily)
MIKAVIFDMDGVLLDSEYAMRTAAMQALKEWGVTADHPDFTPFVGTGEDRFIGGVAELHGVPYTPDMKHRAYQIYLETCEDTVIRFPNIPETFEKLTDMGLNLAIASSADDIKVQANISVAGINPMFLGAIVTGDDVQKKKPNPDAFLLAAERLGIEPEYCVVIEDAKSGIQAALNAGMKAIGITSFFTKEDLLEAGADFVAEETHLVPDLIAKHLLTS